MGGWVEVMVIGRWVGGWVSYLECRRVPIHVVRDQGRLVHQVFIRGGGRRPAPAVLLCGRERWVNVVGGWVGRREEGMHPLRWVGGWVEEEGWRRTRT